MIQIFSSNKTNITDVGLTYSGSQHPWFHYLVLLLETHKCSVLLNLCRKSFQISGYQEKDPWVSVPWYKAFTVGESN